MSSLAALIATYKQPYFVWNLLYISRKASQIKGERLSIPNLDLNEGTAKVIIIKIIFSAFLQVSCSNFRLQQCQMSQSYKTCQANQI